MTTTTVGQKGKVIVEKDRINVEDFETYDKDIVNYFQSIEPEEQVERFENALKVGVVAVKTVGLAENINYIEKEFQTLNHDFTDTLDSAIKEMDKKYEEIFGEKGKFGEIIQQNFGENGKIIKDLFDPNKEGTPLYNLRNDFRNEITQLRQQLSVKEKEEEIIKKTPLKGEPFEVLCENIISQVCRHYGDILENTTKKQGKLQGSKDGDLVSTISENGKKIVFEVKDVASISIPEIQRKLEESIENREASYGVFVVKNVEALPKSIGWFQEFGNNMLACALSTKEKEEGLHYELLLIACKWARTRVMLQGLKESKVNAEFVQNKITKIQNKMKELRTIKTQCTNIMTASDQIKTIAKELEDEIGMELSDILGSITSK
jgi:hypothetical protein